MVNERISKLRDTYDCVIYLAGEWELFSKRHLIYKLAQQLPNSRILCVARPICLLTSPLRHPKRFLTWLIHPQQIVMLDKNLFHFRPCVIMHDHLAGHLPPIGWINRHWLQHQLRAALKRIKLRNENLFSIIYDPFQLEYLNLIGESLSIYDRYDEYIAKSQLSFLRTSRQMLKREQVIFKQVDLVLAVSETIRQQVEKEHHKVQVLPNGVDARHFGLAVNKKTYISSDVAGITHPIIGCLGNISSRIDFDLLRYLSTSHTEWSVVLIGGIEHGFSIPKSLLKSSNFHCLGAKSYKILPNYLKAFDVCIIPYKANDPFNISCSPLKLYEYLATGKPIVSTDLPAVRSFDGLVRISHDAEEFERHVAEALEEQDADLRRRRLLAANENSWEKRAERVLEIISQHVRGQA